MTARSSTQGRQDASGSGPWRSSRLPTLLLGPGPSACCTWHSPRLSVGIARQQRPSNCGSPNSLRLMVSGLLVTAGNIGNAESVGASCSWLGAAGFTVATTVAAFLGQTRPWLILARAPRHGPSQGRRSPPPRWR